MSMQAEVERNTKNVKVKESVLARLSKLGNAGMNYGDVVEMVVTHYENCQNKGDSK